MHHASSWHLVCVHIEKKSCDMSDPVLEISYIFEVILSC